MRTVAWFSCGAASAVAAKEAIEKYGGDVSVVYCDTSASEHPDNERFMRECEAWFGMKVERIRSESFETVDEVFERTRYMSGIAGARCTVEMKKVPRFAFQRGDDVHVFGLTADELPRIERLTRANPELTCDWILRDLGITKAETLRRVQAAGIVLPAMYRMGYDHNNCIGCVKATSPKYWDMVRRDFPEIFSRRAGQSRRIGVRLARVNGVRVFIDEVPRDTQESLLDDMTCGPECGRVA